MRNRLALAGLSLLFLAACGGDDGPASSAPDTSDPETGADASGTDTETLPDTMPDEDTTDGADAEDAAEDTNAPLPDVPDNDVPDGDEPDSSDDDTPELDTTEPDAGPTVPTCAVPTDCADDRVCIQGLCQVPIAGLQVVEDAFVIAEPSEVSHVFNIIKDLAVDVRFMMLDVRTESLASGRVPARYGPVDVLDRSGSPIEVSWQDLPVNPSILFEPQRDEDGGGDGRTWITLPFDLNLLAIVAFDFAGFGSFSGEIGFEALDVTLEISLADDDATTTTLVMRGNFTREEASSRFMATYEDFRPLIPLLCRSNRNYVPETPPGQIAVMRLSDVLDCNGADMDVDIDGDGENDAYYTEIRATMVPALLID